MRIVLVLFLTLTAHMAQADAWGDCRDSLKAAGVVFSTDSSVSGVTLIQTLAGLSFEPTVGEEPVVTITFENGERAVLDEGNTVFLSRWMIVNDLMQANKAAIGSYFIMKDQDISLIRDQNGCRQFGIVTVWPNAWSDD